MERAYGPVECGRHGSQPATFTCQHVARSVTDRRPVGFWTSADTGDPRPNAWCSACEEIVRARGGEWDDDSEAFAGVTLLCGACYDDARRLNR